MKKYKNIDDYISAYPRGVQITLRKMRAVIHKAAPKATEKISYGIPTFYLNGNLVHFGAFKNHVSFFPGASGIYAFKKYLSKYTWSKGTVQFPLDKPVPYGLVDKIVKYRVKQNSIKKK